MPANEAWYKRMEKRIAEYTKNLESKVAERTAALEEAQQHVIRFEKLAATGRLAASIAHEINSPIYGIRGCLQSVLEEAELSGELREYVTLSIQETDRISDLVRRMQDLHRTSRQRLKQQDAAAVLKDVLVLYGTFLRQKKIALDLSLEPRLPKVRIRSDEIKQVFLNLINNAVEAMPEGGTLALRAFRRGGKVEFHFKDTGPGIPDELKERIFDAFFTTKTGVKGVGLGLPICWDILQRHGGRLQVEGRPGEGSTFVMTLPSASTGRKTAAPWNSRRG